MQQISWMSLLDTMFLESKSRRDGVEMLVNSLGLNSKKKEPNQLSHLCQTGFGSSNHDQLVIVISLSSSRMIRLEAHDKSKLSELRLFAHLVQLALETAERRESLVLESMTDPLTMLMNRRGFEHYVASIQSLRGTLVFCDVDRLKQVNQSLGYQLADEKLKSLGAVLSGAFRSTDCVCRWGGDEFLVFFKDSDQMAATKRIIDVNSQIRRRTTLNLSYGFAEFKSGNDNLNSIQGVIAKAQWEMEQKKLAAK